MWSRADDAAADFAKANSITITLAPASDRKGVAIFEPFSAFTARKFQRIGPAPGQFQHAAPRFLSRPADCATREEVARLKVAAVDSVVRQLLRDAPVKVLEVRAGDCLWLAHFGGLQACFQLDVESKIICAF